MSSRVLRSASFASFVALVVLGASCTSLPDIEVGTCGNGVVESDHNEDCDNALTNDAGESVCYPPGSSAACHFRCSGKTCPSGFSCSADGVCRKPKGIFTELGHGVQVDADHLLVGDFDRDGLGDVVAQTNVQMNVLYGDPTGLGSAFTIRAPSSNPAVGQLSYDPKAAEPITSSDLVFAAGGGGITTWLGDDDRTLEPTPYPSFQLSGDTVHVFEARVLAPTDDIVAFISAATVAPGKPGGFFVAIAASDTPSTFGAFGYEPVHIPADIVGDIQVAQMDEGPASPCEEFTAGFTGDSKISVFTTCSSPTSLNTFGVGGGTLNPPILPTEITLLGGSIRPEGIGVRLADINGDGHVDIFIDAQDSAKQLLTLAAYGVGDGTFNSDAALAGLPNTAAALIPSDPRTANPPILAIGQLTNDKQFDFVTRNVIVLQGDAVSDDGGADGGGAPSGFYFADQPWNDALIADMDGDTVPDVVAGGPGRVDYFRGSNTPLLTHIPYAVDGTAGAFTVGHFDDDLTPDIALRAVHDNKDHPELVTADLDILWGRFLGTPEDPKIVGHFGPIASIGTGVIAGPGGNDDFFSDLGVVVGNSAVPFSISVLASSADRQLQAPLYLQETRDPVEPPDPLNGGAPCGAKLTSNRHTGLALAFAVGELDGDDGHPDLVTAAGVIENIEAGDLFLQDLELAISKTTNTAQLIASDPTTNNSGLLYTTPFDTFDAFEPGSFEAPTVQCAPAAGTPVRLPSADWRSLSMATVDFDGPSDKGVDEIVGVAPALRTSVGFNQTNANTFHDKAASGALFWAKKEGGGWNVKSVSALGVLPDDTNRPAVANLQVADLNGDGAQDLLLLTSGGTSNTLVAYINKKDGNLPAAPILISLPSYASGATETPFTIVSVAAIDADANPGKEVALLTDKGGLFLATSNAAGDAFTVTGPLCKNADLAQCQNTPNARIPSGTAIAATDVDGDGVTDLVIESNLTLHVYKGVAVDP